MASIKVIANQADNLTCNSCLMALIRVIGKQASKYLGDNYISADESYWQTTC
jgi:hypothetical protein